MTNLNLYVKKIGKGVPIIFIHGFGLNHHMMVGAFEPLLNGSEYERFYIDLPGMGKSGHQGRVNNADDMIEQVVLNLKDHLDDRPFLLVGMSYGAYIARGVLKAMQNQVKGMFLFAPVVHPIASERQVPQHQVIFEDFVYTKTMDEEALLDAREMNVMITPYVMERQASELEPGFEAADETFLETFQAKGYKATYKLDDLDKTYLGHVSVLCGKQDAVVGYKDQFDLINHYPNATYAVLHQAGHLLHIEQVDLFNAHVNAWLNSVEI